MFTHGGTHVLGVEECRRFLETEILGRIALSVGALPAVLPVLYWLTGDRLVFAVGTDALYDALADNVVAFEVDHVDLATHEGWTVMAIGRAHPADDLASSRELWARPTLIGQPRLIGVSIDRLSGLRIGDA